MSEPRPEPLIRIAGLEKRFGKVQALRGVDLELPPGSVGLLGPNGAGKSTLIKLLLGMLVPDRGTARIVGQDPRRRSQRLRMREAVGYMPESDCLLPNTTGVELVSTLARLTGLSAEDAMTRTHEVLDYVQLEEARYRPVAGFSTGMKQRLKLAQALVHDPQVLLLDEPTNGLDPKGRRQMLELIHDLGTQRGKNVVLCTHLLPDVERTCEHVVVLSQGRVVEQGRVGELTRGDQLTLEVRVAEGEEAFRSALDGAGIPWEPHGEELALRLDGQPDDVDAVFALAADAGCALSRVEPRRSTLEQVFLRAVGHAAPVADDGRSPNPEQDPLP